MSRVEAPLLILTSWIFSSDVPSEPYCGKVQIVDQCITSTRVIVIVNPLPKHRDQEKRQLEFYSTGTLLSLCKVISLWWICFGGY